MENDIVLQALLDEYHEKYNQYELMNICYKELEKQYQSDVFIRHYYNENNTNALYSGENAAQSLSVTDKLNNHKVSSKLELSTSSEGDCTKDKTFKSEISIIAPELSFFC